MLKFLHGLFSGGELIISLEEHAFNESQLVEALTALERQWRCELPGDPPAFLAVSAVKATRILMAFCRAVIHRQVSVAQTEQFVREVCLNNDDTASQHYSVDLVLRFLPQVVERARRISDSDGLLNLMAAIGREWPLSSVGMKGCLPNHWPNALSHPTLWRMYVDRIISAKDISRINIPVVRDAVAAAIGPFPHLAPEFSTENPVM